MKFVGIKDVNLAMNVPAKTKAICKKERCGKQFIQRSKTNLYCPRCHRSMGKFKKVNQDYSRDVSKFLNRYREGDL